MEFRLSIFIHVLEGGGEVEDLNNHNIFVTYSKRRMVQWYNDLIWITNIPCKYFENTITVNACMNSTLKKWLEMLKLKHLLNL